MLKKFKGSYYGFLIGDAFGVPLEFEQRDVLMKNPVTDMKSDGTYNVPKGSWSDDSSIMLATMDSIISEKGISYYDLMKKYSDWVNYAKYTSVDEVFDIGRTTLIAITRFIKGSKPLESGLGGLYDNGNGSLTRMLPIAFYLKDRNLKENEIVEVVSKASSLTHSNEISKLGCYIYVRYIMFLLDGYDKHMSYQMLKNINFSFFDQEAINAYDRLLNDDITTYPIKLISSSGYIVDTLESVIWCINNTRNFKEAIIGSVNLGGDTDTIGALTGSIAGIIYSYDNIPKKWVNSLQKLDYLKLLYNSFVKILNN